MVWRASFSAELCSKSLTAASWGRRSPMGSVSHPSTGAASGPNGPAGGQAAKRDATGHRPPGRLGSGASAHLEECV